MKNRVIAGMVVLAFSSFGQASVLYDNGGFVTNPTGGTGAIAGLPISQADGFTLPNQTFVYSTTGVGATVSANTAVADDFEVTGGGWDLDSLTVYAFQTGQSSPSVTSIHLNLWTQTPYSVGSPGTLPDPLPTPMLVDDLIVTAGQGTLAAHRQSPSSTSTNRPVFAYTISLDGLPDQGQLDPGVYWLEWSFDGALTPSANVFTPLVTPRTITSDWNARLFNTLSGQPADPRVWFEGREGYLSEAVPGRAYELPFILGGTEVPEPGIMGIIGLMSLIGSRRRR